jgi:DNA-directed RNA polymerase specialized sigma24 family protein
MPRPLSLLSLARFWLRPSPSRQDTPVTADGGDEQRQALYRAAVEALPGPARTAFLLHRRDGMEIAAIAERMQRSSPEVEGLLADALLALIDVVEDGSE